MSVVAPRVQLIVSASYKDGRIMRRSAISSR